MSSAMEYLCDCCHVGRGIVTLAHRPKTAPDMCIVCCGNCSDRIRAEQRKHKRSWNTTVELPEEFFSGLAAPKQPVS